jgi:polyhydroxybutyrate depolymerase
VTVDEPEGERTALLHVPEASVGVRAPLVLNFHGYPSTAVQQQWLTGMDEHADAEGYLVAYPEGWYAAFNAGGDCCGPPLYLGVDDVRFSRDLVAAIAAQVCVDLDHVFATGMSNGGYMAHELGCAAADVFAAIAPVSGLQVSDRCEPSRPVPVIDFHGTGDAVVPYDGSDVEPSVAEVIDEWVARNGCVGEPQETFANGAATCATHLTCDDGAQVTLCTIEGGGHTWPDGQDLPIVGPTTHDLSANDAMWSFFRETTGL